MTYYPGQILSVLGAAQKRQNYQQQRMDDIDKRMANLFSQAMQSQRPQYCTAALGPSVFAGLLAGMGPVMMPPTEREIAEAELKAFLGDDLWKMEWLNL